MASRDGGEPPAGNLELLAGSQRPHPVARLLRGGFEPGRDDDDRRAGEAPEREPVEVVGVGMRDQDDVDGADRLEVRRRAVPPQRAQSKPEEGVGQDPHPWELDEDRGVADIDDADLDGGGQAPSGDRHPTRFRSSRERGTRIRVKRPPTIAPSVESMMSSIVSL